MACPGPARNTGGRGAAALLGAPLLIALLRRVPAPPPQLEAVPVQRAASVSVPGASSRTGELLNPLLVKEACQ